MASVRERVHEFVQRARKSISIHRKPARYAPHLILLGSKLTCL